MKAIFYFVLLPALLPVAILLFFIYKKDKAEREPFSMLLKVFIFGAIFSPLCIPTENTAHSVISTWYPQASIAFEFYNNFFGVALVEEITKWIVLMIFVWRSKDFNYKFDGVIYAATSSLGFAALENIIYVLNYGTGVAVSRAIFAIPAHCAFGILMGYFFARSKKAYLSGNKSTSLFYMILSLAVPTTVHGIYDFLLGPAAIETGLDTYFFLMVAIMDGIALFLLKKESDTDHPLIESPPPPIDTPLQP